MPILAAPVPEPLLPGWVVWIHLVGVIVYAGGVLTLSRLLGKAVRFESPEARAPIYAVFRRMYLFVNLPGAGLLLLSGLYLLHADPAGKEYMKQGYFHMKFTFVFVVAIGDFVMARSFLGLNPAADQPSATRFRILHGVIALGVIGVLAAIYIVRGA